MDILSFKVLDNEHKEVDLSIYKGKVLLVINTATKCGFTPQYEKLEALYKRFNERGFEILDFPCNQFLSQAPGTDEEIDSFCKLQYNTTFKRFAKIDVNGENADPIFKYLKDAAAQELDDKENLTFKEKLASLGQSFLGKDIKWNFTKFLIDREGNVKERFSPVRNFDDIALEIEKLL